MKYKILQENTFGKSLKQIVSENREFTNDDINFFINPTNEYVEMPLAIKNMDSAMKLFIEEIDKNSKIGVLCDPDVDGICSTTIIVKFLKEVCDYKDDNIEIFIQEGKVHGLSTPVFKQIKNSDINFLIIPDAATNDEQQIKDLLKDGKKILILDHHIPSDENMKTIYVDQNNGLIGVIVNNQFNDYANAGSGAYVVIKFLEGLTEMELIQYYDLVAVANIADSMYILDRELIYYVNKGLNNINNSFFKYALQDLNLEKITPIDISFNVANIMNAVCRYGTVEENKMLVKALLDVDEVVLYTPKKSKNNPNPQEIEQSLAEAMVRISKSIKQKQDNAVKKSIKKITEWIKENKADEHKVIVIINEEKGTKSLVEKNIGGLIANKLMDTYKRPIMILHKCTDEYMGSMRGNVESFKKVLESTEIVRVVGHENAGGVFVAKKDMPRLLKRLDKAMENIEINEDCVLVDCEVDLDTLRIKEMEEIVKMKPIFNQHCQAPKFLIKDLVIDSRKIRNPYTTLLTFEYNGIEIQKPYCSGVFKKYLLKEDEVSFGKPILKLNLIVEIEYDNYRKRPCFKIVNAESEIVKDDKKKKDKNIPF